MTSSTDGRRSARSRGATTSRAAPTATSAAITTTIAPATCVVASPSTTNWVATAATSEGRAHRSTVACSRRNRSGRSARADTNTARPRTSPKATPRPTPGPAKPRARRRIRRYTPEVIT